MSCVSRAVRVIRNPILAGFYPDPSICRVENDFYLVNSTFAYFPGIPVFHSRDLCHWEQIGNAIDRPGQICYDGHQVSEGLFAPTIRYNKGTFYILCTLIRTGGNFIITAQNPAGPWSDPVWLGGADGGHRADGIDPSIFFDDDGKVWYIGTHPVPEGEAYPGNNEIYIQEMDIAALGKAGKNVLLGEGIGIWRGALRNAIWPEGPHIYKIDGWYYLLYAEGGTSRDHAVCVARAKNIRGPWEGKPGNPILTHRYLGKNAEIVNVGHADWVDDGNGNWWMVLLASRIFREVCPLGRETFMVSIFWEDGWPYVASKTGLVEKEIVVGTVVAKDASGIAASGDSWNHERSCTHFNGKLPPHWLALRMPLSATDAAFCLTSGSGGGDKNAADKNAAAKGGALRLFTKAATLRGWEHPAFVGLRLRHENWTFTAALEFNPKAAGSTADSIAGESAGIVLFQNEDWHYRFELYRSAAGKLSLRLVRAAGSGKQDVVIADGEYAAELLPEIASGKPILLAACCEEMELSFFYGAEHCPLKPFAHSVDARILSTEYAGGFVGTLAGVFASGNGTDTGNYADVFWAEYEGLPTTHTMLPSI